RIGEYSPEEAECQAPVRIDEAALQDLDNRPDEEGGEETGGEEEDKPRERVRHRADCARSGSAAARGNTRRARPGRTRLRSTEGRTAYLAGSTRILPAATILSARDRPGSLRSVTSPEVRLRSRTRSDVPGCRPFCSANCRNSSDCSVTRTLRTDRSVRQVASVA